MAMYALLHLDNYYEIVKSVFRQGAGPEAKNKRQCNHVQLMENEKPVIG